MATAMYAAATLSELGRVFHRDRPRAADEGHHARLRAVLKMWPAIDTKGTVYPVQRHRNAGDCAA